MSHHISGTTLDANMVATVFGDDLESTSIHAFPGVPGASSGLQHDVVHYALSTNLAYAGHSQSEAVSEHQTFNGFGYAHDGPATEAETTQDAWTWGTPGNTYDLNGSYQTSLLPLEFFNFDATLMVESFGVPQPAIEVEQPVFNPGGVTNDFGFQPLVTAAQTPVLVAPVAAPSFSAHRKTPAQPDANNRLHCPLGCTATFGRPGDYRRHMRKHEPPRYRCMVIECDKTFARAEKLRDHMRQGHRLRLV